MEPGFVIDVNRNANGVSNWLEGPPDKAWYGLRLRGKRKLPVETWRCTRCAYLESYAPE
ncbi:MAG: hypothetical protein ABIT09_01105 [Croceibacterium sp.]